MMLVVIGDNGVTHRGFGFNVAEPPSQPPPRDEDLEQPDPEPVPDEYGMDAEPHGAGCDCPKCESWGHCDD